MIKLPERLTEDFIKKYLSKGDILLWEDYKFKDGSKKTSRFIILTECKNNSFLAIRATSRVELYEKPSVLHREFIKFLPKEDSSFQKSTILDLNRVFILKADEIKQLFGEQIKRHNCISDNILDKLEKLITDSRILRKDWISWISKSKKSDF